MGVDRHRAGWADAPESVPTPLALTCDMCLSCGLEQDLACPAGPKYQGGARKLWSLRAGSQLPSGSSWNGACFPLTLTEATSGEQCLKTLGWGPRCAPPWSQSPGYPRGGVGTQARKAACLWLVCHQGDLAIRRCAGLSSALPGSWGGHAGRGGSCSHPSPLPLGGSLGSLTSVPCPQGCLDRGPWS